MSTARIVLREAAGAVSDEVERKLGLLERAWDNAAVRKTAIILALALAWEIYGRLLDNPLLFPTLTDTLELLVDHVRDGSLPARAWASVKVLLMGYVAGVLLAGALTVLAINTRIGSDFLETLTAMFSPLPAIALLPLALIWFGLGNGSLVFILIHSVLWAVALNTHSGFRAVSQTLRMVGRNYGLKGRRLHREDPDPGGVPVDPDRPQDRLGLRLAHADRGRAGVRRLVRPGRARLVHLREPQPARHPGGVRRAADRHHDRPRGREPDLPHHRAPDRAALGPPDVTARRRSSLAKSQASRDNRQLAGEVGGRAVRRSGRRVEAMGSRRAAAVLIGIGWLGAAPGGAVASAPSNEAVAAAAGDLVVDLEAGASECAAAGTAAEAPAPDTALAVEPPAREAVAIEPPGPDAAPVIDLSPPVAAPEPLRDLPPADLPDAPALFRPADPVARALAERLQGEGVLHPRLARKEREAILAFYALGDFKPVWIRDGAWTASARAVRDRLRQAGEDGLDPGVYAVPDRSRRRLGPARSPRPSSGSASPPCSTRATPAAHGLSRGACRG